MASEAQKAAMRRYYQKMKNKKRVYMLRFDRDNDSDVIARLDKCANKAAYIRDLVRGDTE